MLIPHFYNKLRSDWVQFVLACITRVPKMCWSTSPPSTPPTLTRFTLFCLHALSSSVFIHFFTNRASTHHPPAIYSSPSVSHRYYESIEIYMSIMKSTTMSFQIQNSSIAITCKMFDVISPFSSPNLNHSNM